MSGIASDHYARNGTATRGPVRRDTMSRGYARPVGFWLFGAAVEGVVVSGAGRHALTQALR